MRRICSRCFQTWRFQSVLQIQPRVHRPNRLGSENPVAIVLRTTPPSFAVCQRLCLCPLATGHVFCPGFRNAFRAEPETESLRQCLDSGSNADCCPVSPYPSPERECPWLNFPATFLLKTNPD